MRRQEHSNDRKYLKRHHCIHAVTQQKHEIVRNILDDIEAGGDAKALEYAAKFDNYDGEIILTDEAMPQHQRWCQKK